jgi:hypothetical protein
LLSRLTAGGLALSSLQARGDIDRVTTVSSTSRGIPIPKPDVETPGQDEESARGTAAASSPSLESSHASSTSLVVIQGSYDQSPSTRPKGPQFDSSSAFALQAIRGATDLGLMIPAIPMALSQTVREGHLSSASDSGARSDTSLAADAVQLRARPWGLDEATAQGRRTDPGDERDDRASASTPQAAPALFGLGLIADAAPFDRALLDAAVARFLERIEGLEPHRYASFELISSTFVVLFAAFALQMVWRRHGNHGAGLEDPTEGEGDSRRECFPNGFREWPGSWSVSTR